MWIKGQQFVWLVLILWILIRRNFIELPTKVQEAKMPIPTSHYRITSTGTYYVRRLIKQFTYVDAMLVHTPILDKDQRYKIVNVYKITDRLTGAVLFCDYLDT